MPRRLQGRECVFWFENGYTFEPFWTIIGKLYIVNVKSDEDSITGRHASIKKFRGVHLWVDAKEQFKFTKEGNSWQWRETRSNYNRNKF